MRSIKILVLAGVFTGIPLAAARADASYVLVAPNWGARQTAAVQAAGGSLVFAHERAGIGVATSGAPDFLVRALAGNAFQYGAGDEVIQWQQPGPVEEAVTPGDETFFPIQWNLQAVEAPAAWAAGCTGQGARVAVVDGGIHSTHVDLAPNLDAACSTSFIPGFTFDQDVGTFWHGTHVAGIVAAADNGVGTLGVAPEATIVGVKVLHNGSGSFGAVIAGILYAADPSAFGAGGCAPADVINLSLGTAFPKDHAGSLVAALDKAVNFAASQGVLAVSAAGGSATDFGQAGNLVSVPADSGSGLAVSATGPVGFALGATNFRRPASYSDYGEGFIFAAGPGGDSVLPGSASCTVPVVGGSVTAPCWQFDMVISPCRGSGASTTSYCFAAGTSMAAPAVSGVAALLKGRFPGISLGALKGRLAQSADDEGKVGHDEFYGHGFVNARRACTE
jgi:subtilisin family serine protease